MSDIRSFILENNILTTMAGVTIAFSTGTMIRSLVGDIILPLIYSLLKRSPFKKSIAFVPINSMHVDTFIKELSTWVVVILVTYWFIAHFMKKYILKVSKPAVLSKNDNQIAAAVIVDA